MALLGPKYRWLIWDPYGIDRMEIAIKLQEGDNVALLKPTDDSTEIKSALVCLTVYCIMVDKVMFIYWYILAAQFTNICA